MLGMAGADAGRTAASVLALAERGTRAWTSSPVFVLITVLFPIVFLVAFAGGLEPLFRAPDFDFASGYTAFVYGFVVLQAAAFGGILTGYSAARDFEVGIAQRLYLTAPRPLAVLGGYVCVAVIRSLLAVGVVTVLGLAMGMRFSGNLAHVGLMLGLVCVVATMAALWSCGVAFRVRRMRGGPLMHTPILLVLFLAPVYTPLAMLEGWLRRVAELNPLTYVIETTRGAVDGAVVHVPLTLAMVAIVGTLLTVWAARGVALVVREGLAAP